MFTQGSRHQADVPELLTFEIREGAVEAEWRATGSSVYAVTARGEVRVSFDERGKPHYDGLKVRCSCPDGERQNASSDRSLCKHAFAAIQSVVDPDADATIEGMRKAAAASRAEVEAAQDKELPGERDRVKNALAHLSSGEVVKYVARSLGTLEGLRAVARHVFPPDTVAAPNVLRCLRCKEDYDPSFCGKNPCKVRHPFTRTEWDTSKKSWEYCRRCGATFNLWGAHSGGKRGVRDDGEYCFEGDHTTDPVVFSEENWEDPDY